MALTKQHATVSNYRRSKPPQKAEKTFMYTDDEFKKVQHKLDRIMLLLPQAADVAPDNPYIGMQRYAIAPWDPLGTGDAWVYWDGAAWTAL